MVSLVAPPRVRLTPQELHHAGHLGLTRQYGAMSRGDRDSVNEKNYPDALNVHVIGAMGEMAVAQYLGFWFKFTEGTYKIYSDLQGDIEVRTRSNEDWDLLVRPNDADESTFILATLSGPDVIIQGWIKGRDAKRDEWMRDWGNKGRPVYSVPKKALEHISVLRNKYRD